MDYILDRDIYTFRSALSLIEDSKIEKWQKIASQYLRKKKDVTRMNCVTSIHLRKGKEKKQKKIKTNKNK